MVYFQAFELMDGSKISLSSNSWSYLPNTLKDIKTITRFLETTLSDAICEEMWFRERLSFLQLMESQKDDDELSSSHVERFLFNDYISREICTLLGPIFPARKKQRVYKIPSHLPGLPMRKYIPLPPTRSDIFPFGNAWTSHQAIGKWHCSSSSVSLALFQVLHPKTKFKSFLLHVYSAEKEKMASITNVLDLVEKAESLLN